MKASVQPAARGRYSRRRMRLHWTEIEGGGKELARLVTCNYKVRVAPSCWVSPRYRRRRTCATPPVGTQGMRLPSPRVAFMSAFSKGKSKAIRPKFLTCSPCTFKRREWFVHATSTCPNDDDCSSSIDLCMIGISVQLVIRNNIYLKAHTIHGPATIVLKSATSDLRPLLLARPSFKPCRSCRPDRNRLLNLLP